MPAVVVGPASDDRIEGRDDLCLRLAVKGLPGCAELRFEPTDRLIAGRNEELVTAVGHGRRVLPNGEPEEVEALGDVNDAGIIGRQTQSR